MDKIEITREEFARLLGNYLISFYEIRSFIKLINNKGFSSIELEVKIGIFIHRITINIFDNRHHEIVNHYDLNFNNWLDNVISDFLSKYKFVKPEDYECQIYLDVIKEKDNEISNKLAIIDKNKTQIQKYKNKTYIYWAIIVVTIILGILF